MKLIIVVLLIVICSGSPLHVRSCICTSENTLRQVHKAHHFAQEKMAHKPRETLATALEPKSVQFQSRQCGATLAFLGD
jgi:hypothetical protein